MPPTKSTPLLSPHLPIGDWTPRLGGPDYTTPRAEIEADLANVMASKAPADLEHWRLAEIERLQELVLTATENGGLWSVDDVTGTD